MPSWRSHRERTPKNDFSVGAATARTMLSARKGGPTPATMSVTRWVEAFAERVLDTLGLDLGSASPRVVESSAASDNFATVVVAVEGGRVLFGNMRKFVVYNLAHLVPEAIPFTPLRNAARGSLCGPSERLVTARLDRPCR